MFFVFLWPEKTTYMDYKIYQLPNGLRLIHKQENTPVCYCGMVVDAGSRDEMDNEHGLAHLVEHLMFKGTLKRRSVHIINCLENVGGELNAFTSKEETVVYAAVLSEHLEKAFDLIGDIIFNSVFPEKEIEKEKIVILDEIQSYNDSPSELIYDDFEEMLFHEHPLGHNILGDATLLNSYTQNDLKHFTQRLYTPSSMVFYLVGKATEKKLLRWAEKYFVSRNDVEDKVDRVAPTSYSSGSRMIKKDTFQVHQMMGNHAFDLHHPDRLTMYLLNNILGGPGMNSLLNLSLREKHGLVYTVDSVYQPLTDTGAWMIYYGCDEKNLPKCDRLVKNVLSKLCEEKISEKQLTKYKMQLLGQMAIASENRENLGVSMGKSLLRYGKVDSLGSVRNMIMSISAEKLREVAGIAFNEQKLSSLTYL
jgi:predicted Zn-dependent peptidase